MDYLMEFVRSTIIELFMYNIRLFAHIFSKMPLNLLHLGNDFLLSNVSSLC